MITSPSKRPRRMVRITHDARGNGWPGAPHPVLVLPTKIEALMPREDGKPGCIVYVGRNLRWVATETMRVIERRVQEALEP